MRSASYGLSLIHIFLENAVEIDVDVIADRERAVIGAIMQHVEPAGIHSGDSASLIPAMGTVSYTHLDKNTRHQRHRLPSRERGERERSCPH